MHELTFKTVIENQDLYLWEAFLLKICYDALSKKVRRSNDVQHFFIIIP